MMSQAVKHVLLGTGWAFGGIVLLWASSSIDQSVPVMQHLSFLGGIILLGGGIMRIFSA